MGQGAGIVVEDSPFMQIILNKRNRLLQTMPFS